MGEGRRTIARFKKIWKREQRDKEKERKKFEN